MTVLALFATIFFGVYLELNSPLIFVSCLSTFLYVLLFSIFCSFPSSIFRLFFPLLFISVSLLSPPHLFLLFPLSFTSVCLIPPSLLPVPTFLALASCLFALFLFSSFFEPFFVYFLYVCEGTICPFLGWAACMPMFGLFWVLVRPSFS